LHVPGGLMGLIIPAWLGTTYVTARFVYRTMTRRRAKELEEVADRLAAVAQELIPVVT